MSPASPSQPQEPSVFVWQEYHAPWLLPYSRFELEDLLKGMVSVQRSLQIGIPIFGVELYLLDDSSLWQANLDYMGCIGPTNILSFPAGSDLSGTLLLSLDALERESILYGQRRDRHCLRLLAHGIAHLAGLDHGEEHDRISQACEAWGENWQKREDA